MARDRSRIVLIAASPEQRPTGSSSLPASEVYVSRLFRASLEYARMLVDDTRIRILSPKYGAIGVDDFIRAHDFPLHLLSKAARQQWGTSIVQQLAGEFGPGPHHLVVLAGEKFVGALTAALPQQGPRWTLEVPPVDGSRASDRLHWLERAIAAAGSPATLAEVGAPALGSPEEDLAAMATFLRRRAQIEGARPGTLHRPAPHSEAIRKVLMEAAATIQRQRLDRAVAVQHLRELARGDDPNLYLASSALFTAAKGIERGKHLAELRRTRSAPTSEAS